MNRQTSHVPISRRFTLAERKHKKETQTNAALPEDADLGSLLVEKYGERERETESEEVPPVCQHILELPSENHLWPMVVLSEGHHLVAALPVLSVEEHRNKALTPSGVYVAVEIVVAIAKLLREEEKANVTNMYQRAWTFILDAIPGGVVLDCNVENIENMYNMAFTSKPLKQPQPFFKPHLYKGRQRLKFMVEESISGRVLSSPSSAAAVGDNSKHLALRFADFVGKISCCADVEGLPDISVPLSIPKDKVLLDVLLHKCTRSYGSIHKQTDVICFSPPVGWFQLASYVPKDKTQVSSYFPMTCKLELLVTKTGLVQFQAGLMYTGVTKKEFEYCTLKLHFGLVGQLLNEVHTTCGTFNKSTSTWNVISKGPSISKEEFITGMFQHPQSTDAAKLKESLESSVTAVLKWKLPGRTLTQTHLDTKQVSMYPSQNIKIDSDLQSSANLTIVPHVVLE